MLQRPAPPGRELTAECKQATARIATLPGRPEGADGAEEVRIAMRDFAERCDAKVAACGLAAVAFVEATLCR